LKIEIYPYDKMGETILELYPLQPANKFLPEWYKKQKVHQRGTETYSNLGTEFRTAKQCPAIQDFVSDGYIIPAWSDIYISQQNNQVVWNNFNDGDQISHQPESQLIGMDTNHVSGFGALKLISPYLFKTPKGYGIHFFDPFYHFKKNIKILPGKVETDIWNEVNFPFEFYKPLEEWEEGEVLFIKAGEPLIQIVMYDKKLLKYDISLNKYNEKFLEEKKKDEIALTSVSSSFPAYKKLKEDML